MKLTKKITVSYFLCIYIAVKFKKYVQGNSWCPKGFRRYTIINCFRLSDFTFGPLSSFPAQALAR